jgi:tRNA-specific 2-thiouridylase
VENIGIGATVFAKIRYSDKPAEAIVIEERNDYIKIQFIEKKNAITPGQSLVIYDERGYVLCGAIIQKED